MYLMTQNEQSIFDIDRIAFISCNTDGEVFIGGNGSEVGFVVGKYATLERAKEVVMDIFINLENTRYEMPVM